MINLLNKRKVDVRERLMTIFLCVLTITMPIVFTASQPEIDMAKNEMKQNSVIDSFAFILSKVISFFDVVPSVTAQQPPPTGCCDEMLNGAKCQDGITEGMCKPGKWHKDAFCKDVCLGCCVNTNNGICSLNSAQGACQGSGILFIPGDLQCQQLPICKKGCCTVGYEKRWETNKTCVEIYHGAWEGNIGYTECLTEIGKEARGCCTYNCKYETVEACANRLGLTPQQVVTQGHFVQRKCYNDVPKCNHCIKEDHKECIPGLPDSFWADSCGNAYVDEVISCTEGTRCITGECSDVKCTNVYDNWDGNYFQGTPPDYNEKERYEGESWCVYDMPLRTTPYANLGSFDPVGSEHWVFGCVEGNVTPIDHSVYRQTICEEVLLDKNTGKIVMQSGEIPLSRDKRYDSSNYLSFASLTGNPWRVCYIINDPQECNKQPYCYWMSELSQKNKFLTTDEFGNRENLTGDLDPEGDLAGYGEETLVETDTGDPDIGKVYAPIRCLPRVSPGFDDNNKYLCDVAATVQCTLLDRIIGDSYPECDDAHWIEFMAQRCRIVGDCGANINWIGESSYKGFLAAEINPEKNASGNIIGKEIERIFDVENDPKFEKFQANVDVGLREVGAFFLGFFGAVLALFVGYLVVRDLLIALKIISGSVSLGIFQGAFFTFLGGQNLPAFFHYINPATIAAAIILLIAYLIPGPQWLKTTLKGIGYSLGTYGIIAAIAPIAGAAGPLALAVLVIYYIFFGVWDVDHIVVKCGAWIPPIGGDKCEKCNEDPMRPCSKYRCWSLGAACMYNDTITIGEDTYQLADAICVAEENDNTQPYIESIIVKNEQGNPVSVNPGAGIGLPPKTITVGQQLSPFSMLTFEVTFNERVFCRWHDKPTGSIEEMVLPFGGENYNIVKRDILGASPYPSDQYIYLRCMDAHGNNNLAEYIFKFDVAPLPDAAPPIITSIDPADGWQFPNVMGKVSIMLYVYDANIPVNCTFSRIDGTKSYDAMKIETGMECRSKWIGSILGCELKDVPLTPQVANLFYFKCKDSAPSPPGPNYMPESVSVTYNPAPPLSMTITKPETGSTIGGCGFTPKTEVTVTTEGGTDNGEATCSWKNVNANVIEWRVFDETGETEHITNATVTLGMNTVDVSCRDSANMILNSTTFNVTIDNIAPVITRMYKDAGSLVIRTDEKATCTYHYTMGHKVNDCIFAANDTMRARKFDSTGAQEHSVTWDTEPWYVKCYDECDNGINEPCTIIYPSDVD